MSKYPYTLEELQSAYNTQKHVIKQLKQTIDEIEEWNKKRNWKFDYGKYYDLKEIIDKTKESKNG